MISCFMKHYGCGVSAPKLRLLKYHHYDTWTVGRWERLNWYGKLVSKEGGGLREFYIFKENFFKVWGGCLILKRIITLKFWKGPEVLAQDRFKLIILNFKKYAFE